MRSKPRQARKKHAPGYPNLQEHLLTRRDLMTWLGASLVTGSIWVSCVMGDDDSGPAYHTARLPSEGDAEVTQASGGSLRFYVNVTMYSDYGYYGLIDDEAQAVEACRLALAEHDFALLAAATQGGDSSAYGQAELSLTETLGSLCGDCYGLHAALTIVEFRP